MEARSERMKMLKREKMMTLWTIVCSKLSVHSMKLSEITITRLTQVSYSLQKKALLLIETGVEHKGILLSTTNK